MEGTPFGRYWLLGLLGRGGMGEVWRAHDSATDRIVAVKVLNQQFVDDDEYQRRFHREARAAAGLNDPHVVPIHGYGEIEGRLYVEMRLIEGRGLDDVLRHGPLNPHRAVHVVEQVASALHSAHRIGLVHRDVKPSNILLTAEDFAYLIDFGIARGAADVAITQTGGMIGTVAYMAPERIRSNVVDARSDVYALTCVLHECLTGARPFPGDGFEQLASAHLFVPPPQPSKSHDSIPVGFDAVIAAGMAKDLHHRYPSVRDMARAARLALNPDPQTVKLLLASSDARPVSGPADSAELAHNATADIPEEFAADTDGVGTTADGPRSFHWPPTDDPDRAPYRGWQPFEPTDAGIFFGRDTQTARALDVMTQMRQARTKTWMVILGPSGSGKSAFLRAGVIPRLHRDDQFLVLPIVRPDRDALDGATGLATAIHAARQALSLTTPTLEAIKTACHGDPHQVRGLLLEIRHAAAARAGGSVLDGGAPTLVLPLDQCEELVAADAGPHAHQFLQLITALTAPTAGDPLDLIVAATIRTDRFEALQTRPELADTAMELFAELKPMPPERFREVILGPATAHANVKHQLAVTADLVERLLEDCREGGDTLPLLSLTLARLYEDYGATSKVLTLRQYQQMGGLTQVVQSEIDTVLSADAATRNDQLAALRAAFIPWLATINPETDQPLRRVARYDDLPRQSRPLVDALVARRLLVKDFRDGHVVVEVALESLLRQWDELAGWLREERANLKTADDLERSATTWETNDRDPAWLLTGSRLTDAEALVRAPGFHERLTQTADFINTSRHAENARLDEQEQRRTDELRIARERQATAEAHTAVLRKRSRVLRTVLAVTAVVAVVAAGLGIFSFTQRQAALRQRDAGTALRLNTEAQAMMAGVRPGGDVRAFQELLAARQLAPPDDGALLHAIAERTTTLKIIDLGTSATSVHDVAFSPDGHRFATAGTDHTVRLWNTDTGQPLGVALQGHTGPVNGVTFSPDGHRLASASSDNTIRLWDADTGQPIGNPIGDPFARQSAAILSVAFSPDGHRLASASSDHTVRLWDADTGLPIRDPLIGHTDTIYSVAFSVDGRRIASASADKTVRLWDADTGQPIGQPLTGHTDAVLSVAFSSDGHRLASAGTDKTVRLWDADTGQPIGTPLTGHTSDVFDVTFSPDGRRLASGSADATVRLWDADTGQPIGTPLTGHTNNVYSVAFSADGHQLTSASDDHTVRLWNADTPLTGHTSEINELAFNADGHRLASVSSDKTLRLWDADTGQPLGAPLTGHTDSIYSVAFSPDGHRLASASGDTTVRLWDADTGQPLRTMGDRLTAHFRAVSSVAFSPDGHRLASASVDHTVRLWNADTGQLIGVALQGHTDWVTGVAFSPDGHRLASASRDHTVRLWNADTGQPIGKPLTGHTDSVETVAFSPDGHRLASASYDNTVRLWDADTGQPIGDPLIGHTGSVNWVAFSPDGHRLASASDDTTVRVWDADTGNPLGDPLTGHTGSVYAVAFSPDGHRLASAGADDTIRLWDVDASPKLLCDKLVANMSHKQWQAEISPDIPYATLCPDLPIAPD